MTCPCPGFSATSIEPRAALPRRRYIVMTLARRARCGDRRRRSRDDRKLALIYGGATLASFLVLRGVAVRHDVAARVMRRASDASSGGSRIANIHRPGALTPAVVLSLGLGLTLLVALTLIDGNIRDQLTRACPARRRASSSWTCRTRKRAEFDALLATHAPDAKIERVPMMRGRVVRLNGVPGRTKCARAENVQWVLEGDRGISYSETVPDGSVVVEGAWWVRRLFRPAAASRSKPKSRDGLGLKVGDSVTVNVARAKPHGEHRQPARRELAVARHQFRLRVFAEHASRPRRTPSSRPPTFANVGDDHRKSWRC